MYFQITESNKYTDVQKILTKIAKYFDHDVKVIELFTYDISAEVLKKMFELSRVKYKLDKSRDEKLNYNIHYFMKYYIDAFNKLYTIKPEGASTIISQTFDEETEIETTVYQLYDNQMNPTEQIISKYISKEKDREPRQKEKPPVKHFANERTYTKEQLDNMVSSFDDIDI